MGDYYNAADVRFLSEDEINAVSGGSTAMDLVVVVYFGTILYGVGHFVSDILDWLLA